MTSFRLTVSPSRRVAGRFTLSVRRELLRALSVEHKKRGLSQADIAREIGVHRSVINRELRGHQDLTLGRVAELAYALGKQPCFTLQDQSAEAGCNVSEPRVFKHNPTSTRIEATTSAGTKL